MTALEPPNLSEVIRRLDDMKADLRGYASTSLNVSVYQADNVARDREMKEVKADHAALEAKFDAAQEARRVADADAARARETAASSKRLMWLSIGASPLAILVVNWLANGGLAHVGS
jgi:anti-sigma factor RsiW